MQLSHHSCVPWSAVKADLASLGWSRTKAHTGTGLILTPNPGKFVTCKDNLIIPRFLQYFRRGITQKPCKMEQRLEADMTNRNGKRPVETGRFDDDPNESKRFCAESASIDQWSDLSIQSWMDQNLTSESTYLCDPFALPLEPGTWDGQQFIPAFSGETDVPLFIEGAGPSINEPHHDALPWFELEGMAVDMDWTAGTTPSSNWLLGTMGEVSVAETTTPATSFALATSIEPSPKNTDPGTPNRVAGEAKFDQPIYDTCFGVILTKAISSARKQDGDDHVFTVSPYGDILKLSYKNTRKYAGIINSEPLAKLIRDFSIYIKAYIHPPSKVASKSGPKQSSSNLSNPNGEVSVRLLVYGLISEKHDAGNLMSDNDLFFQHPLATEVSGEMSSIPYFNPHFLIRPGSQMPDLAQLSLSGSSDTPPAEILDDVSKARLMAVFDLANGSKTWIDVKPSPRLKSSLKMYVSLVCLHKFN